VVHPDRDLPWISIHGGKLTSCTAIAVAASHAIERRISIPRRPAPPIKPASGKPQTEPFPGLTEPVLSAAWCAEREGCWTLEDYLPRGGFGSHNENTNHLEHVAAVFSGGDAQRAGAAVAAYRTKIECEFDRIIPESATS
jgi:hypothetical protein